MKINKNKFSLDMKRLIENMLSLSFLQIVNSLLPLVTLPYLVRVLGAGKYGVINMAQAMTQYFINLTDYGFNMTATRSLSICREDRKKSDEIYSSVMVIKASLLIVSLFVFLLITTWNQSIQRDRFVYIFTFGMVLGNVLFPTWFFQGIENMKYITFLNLSIKVIFTMAIFFVVRQESDYSKVPLLNSFATIGVGIVSLLIIHIKFKVRFTFPSIPNIIIQLKDGFSVFVSTLILSFYSNTPVLILGWIAGEAAAGFYSAGERLIRAFHKLIMPVIQATYPYLSRLSEHNKERGKLFVLRMVVFIGGATLLVSGGIFLFSKPIASIILGSSFSESVKVLKIMSFCIFLNTISTILGFQTMLAFNMKNTYTVLISIAFIFNAVLNLTIDRSMLQDGAAYTELFSSILMIVMSMAVLLKKGILQVEPIRAGMISNE